MPADREARSRREVGEERADGGGGVWVRGVVGVGKLQADHNGSMSQDGGAGTSSAPIRARS